jgi:multimeric flavodoxin WrbA
MTKRLIGLSCGNAGGSAEILLSRALLAAQGAGADVGLVRLDDLFLPAGPDAAEPDDAWWFWERLMESDGWLISAPILSRTVPGRLKVLIDRLLGPNADRAIVERLVAMRRAGEEPAMAFRLDERVLRPRVAGFIAVGGSLTPQWKSLALPAMHILTFSMQTAVVDQIVVSGAGTPRSVVLDEAALQRASRLGLNVASQLGREFDDAEYLGDPGLCPLCHLNVVELHGRSVCCATCGARGQLTDDLTVVWTDLQTSVVTVAEKHAHYEEILATARAHATQREQIDELANAYQGTVPRIGPERPMIPSREPEHTR